jgi:hypothetical protein
VRDMPPPGAAVAEPRPDLRAKLLELRRDALQQLDESDGLDAGLLALVAHTTAALEAEAADTTCGS